MKLTPILFISVLNIFLALVLLINNWKKNKSIIFLSLFLILFSVSGITGSLLVDGGPVWLLALLLNNFAPLYYLYPVLLYFYVRTTVKDSIRLRKYDFLHFIPFVINLVAILPYLLTPFEYKYSVAQKVICNFEAYIQYDFKLFYPHFINQIFRPIQFFAYLVACIVLVIKFFPKIKASSGLLKSQFSFMFASLVFIVVFFLILSLNHFYVAIHQLINNDIHSTFLQSRKFIRLLSGFYFVLPLFIMLNPRFLYGLPQKKDRKQEESQNINSEFIAENVVSETEKTLVDEQENENFKLLSEQILGFFENDKPYLNPNFSVHDVCQKFNIPRHHVQYCFNVVINKSFPDLKNEMRVNYALELLKSNMTSKISIEGIGKNAGFASPSNFFLIFKKITGYTPNQWLDFNKVEYAD